MEYGVCYRLNYIPPNALTPIPHNVIVYGGRAYKEVIEYKMRPSVVVQSLSHVQLFATPWTVAHQAPLSMGIFQARILEWVAMLSSRGSFQLRDQTKVSSTAGQFFTV